MNTQENTYGTPKKRTIKTYSSLFVNGLSLLGLLGFAILFTLAWFGKLGILYRGL